MKKKFLGSNIAIILLAASLLVIIWFRKGFLLGAAESALPFYNLNIYWEQTRWAWAYPALGNVTGIITASAPTYWLLAKIQEIGIPGFIIEATFFWFLFVVSGLSVYLLTRELFPSMKSTLNVLAVLFYWFNPFFLVNIWHRFLYNYMVFFALLPLALVLFIKGLKRTDYRFAIFLGLATGVFSYALTSIAFNILLWLVLGYTALFYLFTEKKVEVKFFIIKFFPLAFVFYILINSWWITQLLTFVSSQAFGTVISSFFTQAGNVSTLTALSKSLGNLIDATRLMHGTFFTEPAVSWAEIFDHPLLVFFEFAIAAIIFWAIYRFRKLKSVLFLGTLFVSALFLTKGNNPPLGELYQFVFIKIPYLQIFRNPFEKFGVLLSLTVAPLFAFGVGKIIQKQPKNRIKEIILPLCFVFVVLIWGFPFWTGLAFSRQDETGDERTVSYETEVPTYYSEANEWFKKQGDNLRFISLPLGDEGITYTWENPYSGVELSSSLFDVPSISFTTTVPFYENIAKNLERMFIKGENFSKIINVLNAKYILVRSDVDWRLRAMRDPERIRGILEAKGNNFEKVAEFGELTIWENKAWNDQKIYTAGRLVGSIPQPSLFDLGVLSSHPNIFLYSGGNLAETGETVVHPVRKFYIFLPTLSGFEERQDIFPHVSYPPSSKVYPLILFKEKLSFLGIQDDRALAEKKLSLLGKRLVEARLESLNGNKTEIKTALNNYRKQLSSFKQTLERINAPFLSGNQAWNQGKYYSIFSRHSIVLSELENVVPKEVAEINALLRATLIDIGISPKFDYVATVEFPVKKRNTYQFEFLSEGEYELLLNFKDWEKYYEGTFSEPIIIQTDQVQKKVEGELSESGLVSYGKIFFEPGIHEISLNTPSQKNLVDVPEEVALRVEHGVEEVRFEISNFDPFTEYEVSLDYWIRRGSGLEVVFEQNNDKLEKGVVKSHFSKFLFPDNYIFDTRNFSRLISPSRGADKAELVLRVTPGNNCESIYWTRGRERCEDEDFRRPYDKATEVLVKNISVTKVMTEEPLLVKVEKRVNERWQPEIAYKKVNPTEYLVKVTGATEPYYLIFSELFNSGWQAVLEDGTRISEGEHFLANAYANGWVIDKPGDYEITLKFIPQDLLEKGKKVSFYSSLGALMFLGVLTWRKRKR